ncbi:NAD(P)H-hydrate dehydratase [Actibacterium sp. MT2.3-13A]|uniref:NAD(P)H-hydrate dehydratase n=1 Tax=Actibacterium sp. MT2.3-13A TaxID=2828332 RepID=UPI001BA48D9D|nr:NAD(P)H-hydrate dehydratase [Actibacterium sp. MT2.3-13A]
MRELLTSAQMRAIEQAAMGSGAVSGLELMERAGRGVVEAIFEEWPALARAPQRAAVLCGPGNNGGDGFVVARLLEAWGWAVELFLYGDPAALPPDARANFERWGRRPGTIEEATARDDLQADVVVDALFGIGLVRPLEGLDALLRLLSGRGEGRPAIVAVDIPSGLCADSGRVLAGEGLHGPAAVSADLTVTFHRAKLGHVLGDGPRHCGRLVCKDIGLSSWEKILPPEAPDLCHRAAPADPALMAKSQGDHKYAHGHALILSGPKARSGAARLAARGALRIGAGLVTVAAPKSALEECAAQLTAIMLRHCDGAAGLDELLEDARLNALCLGPGLGLGGETRDLVRRALQSGRACVLDADALSVFAEAPEALFEMLHGGCVLTPHGGEFARLFPDIAAKLEAPAESGPAWSKVEATRAAAARAGCVVLFKGADTVIADPTGRCVVNAACYARAAPWLATAGAGDVLAGFITGLLARGLAPMRAAETAAALHVEAALEFGPGLIAEDLPEVLPRVLRALELQAGAGLQVPAWTGRPSA